MMPRMKSRDLPPPPPLRKGSISGVRQFVDAMLRSRATLASPASSLGGQLARLDRMSCDSEGKRHRGRVQGAIPCHDDSAGYDSAHRADERLTRHGAYAIVWASLTEEERALLEAMHTPLRFHEFAREVRLCDLRDGDGAVIVALCKGPDGEHNGYARVKVNEPIYPDDEDLAEHLVARGVSAVLLSTSQIRSRVKRANAKIRAHALFRLLATEGDE